MKSGNAALRFTLPVIAENIITTSVGLLFSAILGGIGSGSLAAAGVINQMMSLVLSLFAFLTTGTAVLTARLTGEGDRIGASEIAEHALLLAPIVSVLLSALLYAFSLPIVRLQMPTADTAFFAEGLTYFRIMLLSVPGLVISNALSGVLRAAGESTAPMICTVISNAVQLLSVYLFVKVNSLGIAGTGYAYVCCRYVSALLYVILVFRYRRQFEVRTRNLLHPQKRVMLRIARIGAPAVVDAVAVQIGYVVANSMLVSIGSYEAGVYNVLGSVLMFPQLCQSVGSVITTTLVGQKLGSASVPDARKLTVKLLVLLAAVSALLCVPALLFPRVFFGFFAKEEPILTDSIRLGWLMIPYAIVALGVNVCDPATRVGGETRFVMLSTTLCIWCIRLPLSYLFCFVLDWGVTGMYLANILALTGRTVLSLTRVLFSRWGTKSI